MSIMCKSNCTIFTFIEADFLFFKMCAIYICVEHYLINTETWGGWGVIIRVQYNDYLFFILHILGTIPTVLLYKKLTNRVYTLFIILLMRVGSRLLKISKVCNSSFSVFHAFLISHPPTNSFLFEYGIKHLWGGGGSSAHFAQNLKLAGMELSSASMINPALYI